MREQLVALAAGAATAALISHLTRRRTVLRHVVQLAFTENAPVEDIVNAFDAMCRAMPHLIVGYERGTQCSPESHTKGLTHIFVLSFPSAAARDLYLPHPVHEEFGRRWVAPHLKELCVSDYEALEVPLAPWWKVWT